MSAAPTTQQHVAPTYHAGGGASPEEKAASAESHHGFQRQHRAPGQLELGITEVLEGRNEMREVVPVAGLERSMLRIKIDAARPSWVGAAVGEFFGVFLYTFAGQIATATLVLTTVAGEPQGNLLTIGLAYSFGIAFALIVCATASGGIFHPGVLIAQVIFKGFPLKRVPLYLFFQLLGGFVSSLMVYAMFQSEMDAYHAGLLRLGAAANSRIFSAQGPAGIIALFPPAGVPIRQSFAVEVFGDLFVGLVIAACVDGSNPFVSPTQAPFAIGLSFGVCVWGLGSFGVSLNTARDLGARFACGAIYGRECFQPASYVASAALTNLLFTSVAFGIYMLCLSDSRRAPASVALKAHAEQEHAHYLNATRTHEELLEKKRTRAGN